MLLNVLHYNILHLVDSFDLRTQQTKMKTSFLSLTKVDICKGNTLIGSINKVLQIGNMTIYDESQKAKKPLWAIHK